MDNNKKVFNTSLHTLKTFNSPNVLLLLAIQLKTSFHLSYHHMFYYVAASFRTHPQNVEKQWLTILLRTNCYYCSLSKRL